MLLTAEHVSSFILRSLYLACLFVVFVAFSGQGFSVVALAVFEFTL